METHSNLHETENEVFNKQLFLSFCEFILRGLAKSRGYSKNTKVHHPDHSVECSNRIFRQLERVCEPSPMMFKDLNEEKKSSSYYSVSVFFAKITITRKILKCNLEISQFFADICYSWVWNIIPSKIEGWVQFKRRSAFL
jgi:hypothetical protein